MAANTVLKFWYKMYNVNHTLFDLNETLRLFDLHVL